MASPTIQTLQLAWVEFIEQKMGIPVMFANEIMNRPPREYAEVGIPLILSTEHHHTRYEDTVEGDLDETIDQMVECRFSIKFFRADDDDLIEARDRMGELKLRILSSSGRQHFLQRGLAWANHSPTNDIAISIDEGTEKRAQADFSYYTIRTLQDTVEAIDALTINAHYRGRMNHHDDIITMEKPQ